MQEKEGKAIYQAPTETTEITYKYTRTLHLRITSKATKFLSPILFSNQTNINYSLINNYQFNLVIRVEEYLSNLTVYPRNI